MKKEAKKKNKKDLKEHKLTDWLPTTKKEVELRGWDDLDVMLLFCFLFPFLAGLCLPQA
jgi:hypothetical protein